MLMSFIKLILIFLFEPEEQNWTLWYEYVLEWKFYSNIYIFLKLLVFVLSQNLDNNFLECSTFIKPVIIRSFWSNQFNWTF